MPESEINELWKKFKKYFSPDTVINGLTEIPENEKPSNHHKSEDNEILAIIAANHALNLNQRSETQEKLAERYWNAKNVESVPTDSNVTEAFRNTKEKIRIKYAFKENGIEEILKNKSFHDWLAEKKELKYTVIRDIGDYYMAMIEGTPMDQALKEKDLDKRTSSLNSLLNFISDYYFGKGHIVDKPQQGQAQYSIELWKGALLRLANKLPEESRKACIDGIVEAAGNIISILNEDTPVTYTAPDAKLSNFIGVQDKIAMSDRGWKRAVFDNTNNGDKNFDKYLGLPFMDLGCLYASIARDPEYKDILPQIKDEIYSILDNNRYWNSELAHATFAFGRLYVVLSGEVKSTNFRNERERLISEINEISPTP